MARMDNIYQGLDILLEYEPDGECSVTHDEFWAAGPEPEAMDPGDVEELEDLGWSFDDAVESWQVFI